MAQSIHARNQVTISTFNPTFLQSSYHKLDHPTMLGLHQQNNMASVTPMYNSTPVQALDLESLTSFLESLQLAPIRSTSPKDAHLKAELVKVFAALGFVMTEDRHHSFFMLARRFLSDEINRIEQHADEIVARMGKLDAVSRLSHRDTLEYVAVNFVENFGDRLWPAAVYRRGHLTDSSLGQRQRANSFLNTTYDSCAPPEREATDMYMTKSSSALCRAVSQYFRVAIMLPDGGSDGAALTDEEADALVESIVTVPTFEAIMLG